MGTEFRAALARKKSAEAGAASARDGATGLVKRAPLREGVTITIMSFCWGGNLDVILRI